MAAYEGWRAQVSKDFCFAVKASRYLTHMKKLTQPRDPVRRMLVRARRLGPTLGPVLFQLPAFLRANVERLDEFLAALARQRYVRPLRAALEVRHASWLEEPVIARLRADAARIHAWRRAGLDVYMYFNNDFDGHAWRNARTLKTLAGAP